MGQSKSIYLFIPFIDISFAWMDQACLSNAAQNAGLNEIDYADYEITNILGIYQEFTVMAYGH